MDTSHLVKLAVYLHRQWVTPKLVSINQIEGAGALFWAVLSFCQFRNKPILSTKVSKLRRWIGKVSLQLKTSSDSSTGTTKNKTQLGYRIWAPDEQLENKKYLLTSPDHMILELGELECPLTIDQISLLYYLVAEYDQIDWNNPKINIDQDHLQVYREHLSGQGKRILEIIQKKIPDTIQVKVKRDISLSDLKPEHRELRRSSNIQHTSDSSHSSIEEDEGDGEGETETNNQKSEKNREDQTRETNIETVRNEEKQQVNIDDSENGSIGSVSILINHSSDSSLANSDSENNFSNNDTKMDIVPRRPATPDKTKVKKINNDIEIPDEAEVVPQRPEKTVQKYLDNPNDITLTDKDEIAPKKPVKKINPWRQHLDQFRKEHPELSYKKAMQEAKLTYKKK